MIGSKLPNGFIVLVMSPREAVNLNDQILVPEEYPWQTTEAQMTAMEAKNILREQTQMQAGKDLKQAARQLQDQAEDVANAAIENDDE